MEELQAFVNHGRWMVQCPCQNAEILMPGTAVWRCSILSDPMHHQRKLGKPAEMVGVIWPNDIERINLILMARPDIDTRNWLPFETVEQLEHENRRYLAGR